MTRRCVNVLTPTRSRSHSWSFSPKPSHRQHSPRETLTRIDPRQSASHSQPTLTATPAKPQWWSILILLLALGLGIATRAVWQHAVNRPPTVGELPLEDLQVIEQLPWTIGVDNLDFLLMLEQSALFELDNTHNAPARGSRPPSPRDRDALISLFHSYSPQRRAELRQLDRDLHDLEPHRQNELTRLMQAYAVWLDRLPDDGRHEILQAKSPTQRLATIRTIWEQRWRNNLPKPMRERLNLVANDEERIRLVATFKAQEQEQRDQWQLARRQWETLPLGSRKPWPFNDETLSKEVEHYIVDVLEVPLDDSPDKLRNRRLNWDEIQELRLRHKAAQERGEWFLYGLAIHRTAQRHPMLPKPREGEPITDANQLPKEFLRGERSRQAVLQAGRRHRGEWPEFALSLNEAMRDAKITEVPPLGPARPEAFRDEQRTFVEQKLLPKLTTAERDKLKAVEGYWPDYPKLLLEASVRHDLSMPGVMLPGPPSRWDRFYTLRRGAQK